MVILEWLTILEHRGKIAVYNSDVAGAFDRVSTELLIQKLSSHGVHPRIIGLMVSWLDRRKAVVIVGGDRSEESGIMNEIFRGTVLGPILWDVFFEDAHVPIRKT